VRSAPSQCVRLDPRKSGQSSQSCGLIIESRASVVVLDMHLEGSTVVVGIKPEERSCATIQTSGYVYKQRELRNIQQLSQPLNPQLFQFDRLQLGNCAHTRPFS
jgi:hypothetical protein